MLRRSTENGMAQAARRRSGFRLQKPGRRAGSPRAAGCGQVYGDEVVHGQVDARPDLTPGLGNGPEPLQSARVEDRAVAPSAEDVARAYGQVDRLGPAVALRHEDEGLVPAPV